MPAPAPNEGLPPPRKPVPAEPPPPPPGPVARARQWLARPRPWLAYARDGIPVATVILLVAVLALLVAVAGGYLPATPPPAAAPTPPPGLPADTLAELRTAAAAAAATAKDLATIRDGMKEKMQTFVVDKEAIAKVTAERDAARAGDPAAGKLQKERDDLDKKVKDLQAKLEAGPDEAKVKALTAAAANAAVAAALKEIKYETVVGTLNRLGNDAKDLNRTAAGLKVDELHARLDELALLQGVPARPRDVLIVCVRTGDPQHDRAVRDAAVAAIKARRPAAGHRVGFAWVYGLELIPVVPIGRSPVAVGDVKLYDLAEWKGADADVTKKEVADQILDQFAKAPAQDPKAERKLILVCRPDLASPLKAGVPAEPTDPNGKAWWNLLATTPTDVILVPPPVSVPVPPTVVPVPAGGTAPVDTAEQKKARQNRAEWDAVAANPAGKKNRVDLVPDAAEALFRRLYDAASPVPVYAPPPKP